MRAAIVGGGGYIGLWLIETLRKRGHAVTVLDRFYFGQDRLDAVDPNRQVRRIPRDLRDAEAADFAGIDAIAVLGCLSNDPSCEIDDALSRDINFDGTLRVAHAARAAGVKRLVFASSCSVYGMTTGPLAQSEDSPKRPCSLYARLKLEAEGALFDLSRRDSTLTVTALRPATAFGLSPRMRFDLVLNRMTLDAVQHGRIRVDGPGRQYRPLVHARDIAEAFALALEAPGRAVDGRAFNVGGSEQTLSIAELARRVADAVPGTEIHHVGADDDRRSYRPDFTRITEVLGFRPAHTIDAGIREIRDAVKAGLTDTLDTLTVPFYRELLRAHPALRYTPPAESAAAAPSLDSPAPVRS